MNPNCRKPLIDNPSQLYGSLIPLCVFFLLTVTVLCTLQDSLTIYHIISYMVNLRMNSSMLTVIATIQPGVQGRVSLSAQTCSKSSGVSGALRLIVS